VRRSGHRPCDDKGTHLAPFRAGAHDPPTLRNIFMGQKGSSPSRGIGYWFRRDVHLSDRSVSVRSHRRPSTPDPPVRQASRRRRIGGGLFIGPVPFIQRVTDTTTSPGRRGQGAHFAVDDPNLTRLRNRTEAAPFLFVFLWCAFALDGGILSQDRGADGGDVHGGIHLTVNLDKPRPNIAASSISARYIGPRHR